MTSKTSWRKHFLENAKNRIWALTVVSLLLFIQIPLTAVALITKQDEYEYLYSSGLAPELISGRISKMIADKFLAVVTVQNPGTVFEYGVIAMMLALSGFAYLYRNREVDFYHSLPVRREHLFSLNYVTGAVFFIVPYAVNLVLGTLIMLTRTAGALDIGQVLTAFMLHTVYFLFLYGVFIIAVMMTGNYLTGIMGGAVLVSYGSLLTALIAAYMQAFQITRVWDNHLFEELFANTSPAGLYVRAGFSEQPALYLGIGLLGAAAAAGISLLLYQRRMLEAAGRAMAFRKTEPVIKFLLAAPAAAGAGLMIYYIMNMDGWAVFAIIFTGLIVCFVIEIIYQGDFRKFRKGMLCTAAALAAALLMFAFFRFDLAGYDRYRPAAEKVSGVSIYIDGLSPETPWNYYAEPELVTNDYNAERIVIFKSPDLPEVLRTMDEITDPALADAIIENGLEMTASVRERWYGTRNVYYPLDEDQRESYDMYSTATVRWSLAGGKEVLRSYRVNTTKLKAEIERLYGDPGFLKGNYPVVKLSPADIAAVNYCEWDSPEHVNLPDEAMKDRLFETWKQEFLALTAETREKESPVGALQFKTVKMQAMIDELRAEKGNYMPFNDYYYYPVFPSFTGTIALLQECGISAGQRFRPSDVEKITVEYHGSLELYDEDAEDVEVFAKSTYPVAVNSLVITDPEQIREIMDHCVGSNGRTSNPFRATTGLLSAGGTVHRRDGSSYGQEIWMQFPLEGVPEFLMEYYHLDQETLEMQRDGLF